ncbi:hypothetical protein ACFV1N_43690, partial [Streptosporangium canum]
MGELSTFASIIIQFKRGWRVAVAHLLLVEDDAQVRSALTRALAERGHAVTSASAGMPGLTRALEDRPDLVVLDL